MTENQIARMTLEELYGARCMLTGQCGRLTYHHIVKKCDGGKATVSNGAPLCREAHDLLHYYEMKNRERYEALNDALDMYKKCMDLGLDNCLEDFEIVQEQVLKLVKSRV